jgi:hypothetical protein
MSNEITTVLSVKDELTGKVTSSIAAVKARANEGKEKINDLRESYDKMNRSGEASARGLHGLSHALESAGNASMGASSAMGGAVDMLRRAKRLHIKAAFSTRLTYTMPV